MVVSPISALLLVSVAALVSGAEENGTPLERYNQALNQPGSSFSSVIVDRPSSYDQALKQPVDLLRGRNPNCKTKEACTNAGGECTKKKDCNGKVKKVKKGCSKGCVCCVAGKKPNCKTREACTNAGGECTKKKYCNGKVKKVKKGCSKGCVCCIPDTTCQCGVVNSNTQRIFNGAEVTPKRKYPWQVGLHYQHKRIRCGGTIINDRWILTAAHCIINPYTCRNFYNSSKPLEVWVGPHNQFDTNDVSLNTMSYPIKTYVKHPNYNCPSLDYDFALLELIEAIPFTDIIRPVCLPKDDSKTYAGQTGTIIGWGVIDDKGTMTDYLREIQAPIHANNKCGSWEKIEDFKMCAGGKKNACGGDSGGPMHVVENNKYVQVGVASYIGGYCGNPDYPGVYARVSKVLSWIHTTTANGNKCD